jgi:excisionase family DNA binding protein
MSAAGQRDGVPPNEILTIEEVATYLRLTPQTIYKWAQERRIPAVKLGKEWRFRRSVIDRWFDAQLTGGDVPFANPNPDSSDG